MPIDRNGGQYITANPQQPTQSSAPGIWDIDEQGSAQAAGRWPLPPNVVQRSLRFNTPDSAYLNRTPAVAGNRKLWTYSCWMKRSASGVSYILVGEGSVNDEYTYLQFDSNDLIYGVIGVVGSNPHLMKTVAAFRDYSAWYHIVSIFDTDNAVGADRWQIWVNGVKQSLTVTNTMSQGFASGWINNNSRQLIGRRQNYSVETYSNYYLAEVNFVDGQALTPSSFGQTDAQTGQWIPRVYSGSYGTNGYRLQFLDNSGTTATTLGKDTSGMGNNWTPNNFSVAAGTGNDSLRDVPMNYYSPDNGLGGEVIGNYCTLNPLDKGANFTLTNGNLQFEKPSASSNWNTVRATLGVTSGKWYWEFVSPDTLAGGGVVIMIGIGKSTVSLTSYLGNSVDGYAYYFDGTKWNNNSSAAYGATWTANDVIGVAFDADAGVLTFYKNGVSQGTAFSGLTSGPYFPSFSCEATGTTGDGIANFGQRPFAYTAPSGFKALCTQNFSAPRIGNVAVVQANDYFNAVLYTGTGSSLSVTGTGFQPDLVWIKSRSAATDHALYDAVRGVQKQLESNTTTAETTETTGLTAFGADGFTVGSLAQVNTNTATYVAWQWNAGGSTVTNTSGTITSSVRASQTAGFSVVGYAGNSTAGATVGHGLGAAPAMVIYRLRNATSAWIVYHQAITSPAINCLRLNETTAASSAGGAFNSTAPTSTLLTLGGPSVGTNDSGYNFVAYCFAAVPGFSAFGSYTGNGSTDGPFVYLGFRPKFILIKNISITGYWNLQDSARNTYNPADLSLFPNVSDAEQSGSGYYVDFLSNGFKLRTLASTVHMNGNGNTIIYAAFAEIPFQFANAR